MCQNSSNANMAFNYVRLPHLLAVEMMLVKNNSVSTKRAMNWLGGMWKMYIGLAALAFNQGYTRKSPVLAQALADLCRIKWGASDWIPGRRAAWLKMAGMKLYLRSVVSSIEKPSLPSSRAHLR